jgi:transposase-like protein
MSDPASRDGRATPCRFMAFPPDVRRVIYATNAIEARDLRPRMARTRA